MNRHLILLAHGSPRAEWRLSIEVLAERVRAATSVPVSLAWLEASPPDLGTAAQAALAQGATQVGILPLFWSSGGHVARDLPEQVAALRHRWPLVTFEVLPTLGEHPRVVAAIAAIAAELSE